MWRSLFNYIAIVIEVSVSTSIITVLVSLFPLEPQYFVWVAELCRSCVGGMWNGMK